MKCIAQTTTFLHRLFRRLRMQFYKELFGSHGESFWFDPDGTYSYRNIHVGDNVNLGVRPIILAELSNIKIGNCVMFGPEVVVIGGGHNTSVIGSFMVGVSEKTGAEDLGVVIEDNVWIGSRSIILRGVTVGRGSVIGAGSIVNKSVPPYAVVAGNPAKVVAFRFDADQVLEHELILYPEGRRLDRSFVEAVQREREMIRPLRRNRT